MTYKILLFVFCVCAAMQGEAQGGGGGIGIYFQAAGISGQDNSNMFSGDGIFKYEQAESTTPEIKKEQIITFSPFFDDALIDTFWQEFKYLNPKIQDAQNGHNHVIATHELKRKYLYLLKLVAGDSFEILQERKYIITDTTAKKKMAQVIYKVRSSKAVGYMNIFFTIDGNHRITLQQMNFYPFDHSSNDFIYNLSGNELNLIKTQQMTSVIDTTLRYADNDKIESIKASRKKLDAIKLPVNPLFTYRLFMERGDLWVMGIFDTDKPNVHLSIAYKLVNKKFKPAFIEVLKKETF